MENQESEDASEDFPEEFLCCVCLDLFYKPVVLACGHISCFWCVFKAMDTWQESYCPVCRHPYNYFPSICQMLHFVLLKVYPLAYKRRERQVIEEEKEFGVFSPQFDNYLSESNSSKKFNTPGGTYLHSVTTSHTKNPSSKNSSEVNDKNLITTTPATSSSVGSISAVSHEKSVFENRLVNGCCSQVLMTDLLCAVCKQLLYRPVVLNCGHVYCEGCIIYPNNKLCECPVCQSTHPNGFPKVCLVLEHFLEEHFSEEYVARKLYVLEHADRQYGSPSTCSTQAQQTDAQSSYKPATTDQPRWLSGQGPNVHFGVGCDYCGLCPITGNRYKCTDCREEIGFDLCERCYNSSSELPGRFNQQHTSDHKFDKITGGRSLILSLQAEHSDEDDLEDEYREDVFHPYSSDDNQRDAEAGVAIPNSSSDPSENQQGFDSTA